MRVNNRHCIQKLAKRSLRLAGKRNRIAAAAIALTALLFTAIFTGTLSIYKSDMAFRQSMHWKSASFLQSLSLGTVIAILALIALIMTTGYLIIYNVFQISVNEDIRYYGLLKTIGVTPRQLRKLVRKQAWMLWCAGAPVGLLAGYGIGALLSPFMISSINSEITTRKVSFSPLIFLFAALFSLVTVFFSCSRPARLASRVSPIEAVRYTDRDIRNAHDRKTHRVTAFSMAAAYVTGKKGRMATVLVSLSLAVVLVNMLFITVRGFDDEAYLKENCCTDFVVGGKEYFTGSAEDAASLNESTVSKIRGSVGMAVSGGAYTLDSDIQAFNWMSKEKRQELYESFGYPQEEMEEAYSHAPERGDSVGNGALVEAFDPEIFSKLTTISGELSPVLDQDSHAIAVAVDTDDGVPLNLDLLPAIGDTIDVTYAKFTDEGEVPYDVDHGSDVTYKVAAYVSVPNQISLRYEEAAYNLVLPKETLEKDSGKGLKQLLYIFDVKSNEDRKEAEQLLTSSTKEDTGLEYESRTSILQKFTSFRRMFTFIGGLLCVVITLIGVLNFVNLILTGILSRKREFAVLQAVGMTNRQLRRVLVTEGMIYTAGSAPISLFVLLALYPLVKGVLSRNFWFLSPHLSLLPVILALPVYLLLGWAIPKALYGREVKESIVDRMREIG